MARGKYTYSVCLAQIVCDGAPLAKGKEICVRCQKKRDSKPKPPVLRGEKYRELSKGQRAAAKAAREAANATCLHS